ncbi:hypothetical protein OFD18_39340, partial [Escherichia coli]|nr:hypothetical protein [Escherichia coli]
SFTCVNALVVIPIAINRVKAIAPPALTAIRVRILLNMIGSQIDFYLALSIGRIMDFKQVKLMGDFRL